MSDTRGVSGDLTIVAGDGSEARVPDIPTPVFQALFHEVVHRENSASEDRSRSSIVKKYDVEQLCIQLMQWLSQYDARGLSVSFSVSHMLSSENYPSTETFRDLESFKKYNEARRERVKDLDVAFDFAIKGRDRKKYEGYSLRVSLKNYLLLSDNSNLLVGRQGGGYGACLNIYCDYADYIVGRSLMELVGHWYDGLDEDIPDGRESYIGKFLDFLVPSDGQDDALSAKESIFDLSLFAIISVLLMFSGLGEKAWMYIAAYPERNVWVLIFVLAAVVVFRRWLRMALREKLIPRGYFPAVLLNEGTRANYDKHRRILKRKLLFWRFFLGSVVMAFVVSAAASYIVALI